MSSFGAKGLIFFVHCILKFKLFGPHIYYCNLHMGLVYSAILRSLESPCKILLWDKFLYLKLRFFQNQTENYYSGYKSICFKFKCNAVFLNPFHIYIFIFISWDKKDRKLEKSTKVRVSLHKTFYESILSADLERE